MVDIVDEFDVVIDTVPRSHMRAENLRHRGVGIAVLDRHDRLLVHRRADDKDVWPGYWDMASGGVVEAGESYEVAAIRELAEELGIEGVPLTALGRIIFEDDDVRVISQCYFVRFDGEVRCTDGEVVEVRWVSPEEYTAMRTTVRWCPDSAATFPPLLSAIVPAWLIVLQ